MTAIKNVVSARAKNGLHSDLLQAPAWDFASGKRLATSGTSDDTTLDEGLWLFVAEGDLYYKVGSGTVTADGSSAGSCYLKDGASIAQAITGSSQKVAAIQKSAAGALWAIPAKTE